jgi:tripartite-type tricarboxylate transporter receptor subunit TctC
MHLGGDRSLDMTRLLMIIVALAVFGAQPSQAQDSVADFYKNKKSITLQIGAGTAGDGYDLYGRLVARHIVKYIPGHPSIVVQNVPSGPGGLRVANQFGTTAAKDGTIFGLFVAGMPTTPLLSPGMVSYDPRQFGFIGSPNREVQVLVVSGKAAVKTVDDVFHKEVIAGASSPGAGVWDYPRMSNALLGTKFRIISGYTSPRDTALAIERGEVEAMAGINWTAAKAFFSEKFASGELRLLAQYGFAKLPELGNVPLFPNGSDESLHPYFRILYARQDYGRPLAFPAGVPAERVAAFRQAFAATVADPEFLADAARTKLDINPVLGGELQQLTDDIYRTPPAVLARMQELLNTTGK